MTIGEVSEKYDITTDTLRYYERIGLIPAVPRKQNGIRDYDEEACGWVSFVKCMRSAGVQIEALIEYVALMQANTGLERRKEILIEQRARLQRQAEHLRTTIERLDYKIEHYEELMLKQK
ncbi:MAG: MerR family transcriptional regulator [Selenomonadaceae bacterium]|nr:MerR family transcriptional regulator [Selenomonadaceae bacterium]MBQ6758454.1 MerR family transcriptional regulator [Selenomonadaceae bacterium]MBR6712272.1 MerR family transcriptional regulator [Selenomonadaceae bacterium]